MIVEQFDRPTMAAMEMALERVCECWPHGGTHKLRKRVAQSIIRCAKGGDTRLDALIEAGECSRRQLPTRRKPIELGAEPTWHMVA